MTRDRTTGLNAYAMRIGTGEVVYCPVRRTTGYDPDSAHLWLIEPERLEQATREIAAKVRLGPLVARRAR